MNEKQIKEKIKTAADEFVLDITSDEIVDKYETKLLQHREKIHKFVVPAVTSLVTAGVVLAIVLPLTLIPPYQPEGTLEVVKDPTLIGAALTKNKVEKLAFEATTGFAASIEFNAAPVVFQKRAFTLQTQEAISSTIPPVDLILTNESTFKTTLVESTNPNYSFEFIVSYLGVDDVSYEYAIFFNLFKEVGGNDDSKSRTIIYEGIANNDLGGYSFNATLNEDLEGTEIDSKISMTVFTNASQTSYINIAQNVETMSGSSGQSYYYEVWEKSSLTKQFGLKTGASDGLEVTVDDIVYVAESLQVSGESVIKYTEKNTTDYVAFQKIKTANSETGGYDVSYKTVTL